MLACNRKLQTSKAPLKSQELSQATQVLDHSLFSSELSSEFGESDVKFLCSKCGLSFSDLKFAYRNFKDSRGSVISNELLKLKSVINMIPVSTAACERGFSKMNIICSPLRTRLTVKYTSSLNNNNNNLCLYLCLVLLSCYLNL